MFLIDDFFRALYGSYQEKNGWPGRISVVIFGFILCMGFLPSFVFVLYPNLDTMSDDCLCMTTVFVSNGHDVHYLWFKAVYYWQNMFVCLFLAAVAVNGHSISSCLLLLAAPTTNGIFWMTSMKSELHSNDLGKEAKDCWSDFANQIAAFWIMTALALGGVIVDKNWSSSTGSSTSNYERVPN